jgi:hypothetical protein
LRALDRFVPYAPAFYDRGMSLLLPRTDAGVFAQMVCVLAVCVPVLVVSLRRGLSDLAWFSGGLALFGFGLFAVRTLH